MPPGLKQWNIKNLLFFKEHGIDRNAGQHGTGHEIARQFTDALVRYYSVHCNPQVKGSNPFRPVLLFRYFFNCLIYIERRPVQKKERFFLIYEVLSGTRSEGGPALVPIRAGRCRHWHRRYVLRVKRVYHHDIPGDPESLGPLFPVVPPCTSLSDRRRAEKMRHVMAGIPS